MQIAFSRVAIHESGISHLMPARQYRRFIGSTIVKTVWRECKSMRQPRFSNFACAAFRVQRCLYVRPPNWIASCVSWCVRTRCHNLLAYRNRIAFRRGVLPCAAIFRCPVFAGELPLLRELVEGCGPMIGRVSLGAVRPFARAAGRPAFHKRSPPNREIPKDERIYERAARRRAVRSCGLCDVGGVAALLQSGHPLRETLGIAGAPPPLGPASFEPGPDGRRAVETRAGDLAGPQNPM